MLTLEDVAKAFELYLLYGDDEGITQVVFEESGDLHAERHGKWLDGYGFAGNYYDCSVCNQCKKESMAKTNYCPNCGARMDGEQDVHGK